MHLQKRAKPSLKVRLKVCKFIWQVAHADLFQVNKMRENLFSLYEFWTYRVA
jgi:hypothetical protein